MAFQNLKVVAVGDGAVGKSCFLIRWSTDVFPQDYVPTVFDNYSNNTFVDGKPVCVSLWDTAGQEDYDRLRPLSYPQTDVFLLCFAITSVSSFGNVRDKWVPEIRHYCPKVPILLVGMKGDLREDGSNQRPCVTQAQAQQLAKDVGAVGYFETSALTGSAINDTMHSAMRAGLSTQSNAGGRRRFVWPWKRRSKGKGGETSPEPSIPPPPELPANEKAPWITIPTSTFIQDWAKMINSEKQANVTFFLDSKRFHAHKLILCCASDVFRKLFGIEAKVKVQSLADCPGWSKRRLQKITPENINADVVQGFTSMHITMDNEGQELTEITLDHTQIKEIPLKRCLEFLYTGIVDLNKESELLDETMTTTRLFNLPELQLICENAKKGDEFLNPSIGTWLNDRNSGVAKELFLNRSLFSDVRFKVEGETVHAHKLVLCTRCDVLSAMLTGGFMESEISTEIEIPDVSLDTFLAFQEYLYTDHSPIDDRDSIGILELSDRYVMPRLTSLCELYISKEVEKATAVNIAEADVDVIGLLLLAQLHNAQQLGGWCLHFVSSNYVVYESKEDFPMLTGENLDYVNDHRWPPLSYFAAMEEYREKHAEEVDDDLLAPKTTGSRKRRSNDKCKVM